MALTDPQSITISGTTTSLPRVITAGSSSTYRSNDGLIEEVMSSTYGKRQRHSLRLNLKEISPDPYTSANISQSMSVYTVFDMPQVGYGYTVAEAVAAWVGFNAQLAASSNAIVTKVIGGES